MPTDLIASLFDLAASPEIDVSNFLDAVLSSALSVTGAEIGGVISVPSSRPERRLSSLRALEGTPKSSWQQLLAPRDLAGRPRQPAPGGGWLPVEGDSATSLFEESRRTAGVPIQAGEQTPGWLQVETAHDRGIPRQRLLALGELGHYAGLLTRRLLLREHAAARGIALNLVGMSPALLELERRLTLIAADPKSPVLIRGERGSGKELTAYAIHYFGARRDQPFLAVNCAAFNEGLETDALFGHVRGAYTSAEMVREGLFRHADGGTLFFDEIGDMNAGVQAALLRVLDSGEIRPLGSDRSYDVDVRILAATNKDIERLMDEGSFRRDLFDRLAVFQVAVPPLRERGQDRRLLADFFLRTACVLNGRRQWWGKGNVCLACRQRGGRTCSNPEFYEEIFRYEFPGREARSWTPASASPEL